MSIEMNASGPPVQPADVQQAGETPNWDAQTSPIRVATGARHDYSNLPARGQPQMHHLGGSAQVASMNHLGGSAQVSSQWAKAAMPAIPPLLLPCRCAGVAPMRAQEPQDDQPATFAIEISNEEFRSTGSHHAQLQQQPQRQQDGNIPV